jgi:predicted O-methyltransferase YrrM
VFNLVTKCFYDKKKYAEYSILQEYRNSLSQNKKSIEVTDFGAGSRVFKSNTRQISKIVKTAGITEKRAEMLYRITNYFQPTTILEIGTSLGLATSALSLGNPKAKITTLEGCLNTLAIAQKQFEKFDLRLSRYKLYQNCIDLLSKEYPKKETPPIPLFPINRKN